MTGFGPLEQVIADAIQVIGLINQFDLGPNVMMPLGDFPLDGAAIADDPTAALDPSTLSNLAETALSNLDLSDLAGAAQNLISNFAGNIDGIISNLGLPPAAAQRLNTLAGAVTGGANFAINFPLFDDPGSIINLLFGKDVNLVTFDASINIPSESFSVPTGASIFGLGVNFNANLSVNASLELGYDTYGLRELITQFENGTPSAGTIASDMADGFFVLGPSGSSLGSHFTISGNIGVGLGVNIGIASVNVTGGLQTPDGPITVSLNDQYPDSAHDGKIRLQEIESEIAHGSVFNASGKLTAGLFIEATEGFGPFSASQTLLNIASVTLWQSSQAGNGQLVSGGAPTISSMSATTGSTNGGDSITIYGTNLDGATAVDFGSAQAAIVSDDSTFMVVTTPPYGPYTAAVTVVTASGTSGASDFTYVLPPLPGSISPASGPCCRRHLGHDWGHQSGQRHSGRLRRYAGPDCTG